MAATFVGRSKRTALSTRAIYRTLGPCLARQWRYVETKDHCFANPQEWVGQAGRDTPLDRDIHFQAASAQFASVRRRLPQDVQILLRRLRRPRLSETSAQNKFRQSDPYRSRSCRLILRRPSETE